MTKMKPVLNSLAAAVTALALAGPEPLAASVLCGRADFGGVVQPPYACAIGLDGWRVDRPMWVMVFSLDETGRAHRLTRGRSGVFVSPDYRALDLAASVARNHGDCAQGTLIVVSSETPFALSSERACRARFGHDRRGLLPIERARFCRLVGLPASVNLSCVPVTACERVAGCASDGRLAAELWAGIRTGGRVYVDGGYRGCGPTALAGLAPGRHRLTVITRAGHKQSSYIDWPLDDSPWGPRFTFEMCR
jgi:hypothetical protein